MGRALYPDLSLAPPDELLLDIGGCLRLFGGLEAITSAIVAGCHEQGYTPQLGVAPTALGARWLARVGGGAVCADTESLSAALAALPCPVTRWPAEVLARLESFGLRHLGELRALPGAGLRRRLGNGPLDDLSRAWGELPDPQKAFVFPEQFAASLELPSRVEHAEALIFAGQRLFSTLAGWLHVRQQRVRRCTLHLLHDDGASSAVPLHFAEASAEEGRFLRLLREHLGRLTLRAPVEALRLQADELADRPADSAHLFEQAPSGRRSAGLPGAPARPLGRAVRPGLGAGGRLPPGVCDARAGSAARRRAFHCWRGASRPTAPALVAAASPAPA